MTVTSISTTIAILFCVLVLIPTTAMAAPLNNNERHYSVENEWDEILGNIENGIMMDRQQQPGIRYGWEEGKFALEWNQFVKNLIWR